MNKGALSRREWLGLGAIGVGALGFGQYLRRGAPLGRDVSDIMDVRELQQAPGFPAEGPPDAAISMLVFSDYACGVCRKVEPWWHAAVREAGDVRVIHRDWPILGEASLHAARLALAAAMQGLYNPVHDRLMESGAVDADAARQALVAAGGDWGRLQRDLTTGADTIGRLLTRTAQDAFQLGFRGTPGFLVGPIRIEGGASQRQFADAIERARAA